MRIAFITGAAAALVCIAGLFLFGPGQFFQAYLYSFLFWVGISLGLLGLLMLHFVTSSRWGLTIRRIAEAGAGSIWVMAVLFLPVIIGLPYLFPWARPTEVAASEQLQYQTWYLNTPFFIIRAVIYFAIWILVAAVANRMLARLGSSPTGNPALRGRLQGLGAAGTILYGFSLFFASVDWLMSLQPSWISTAIGVITMIGQVMSALGFAIVILNLFPGLSLGQRWRYDMTPVPYRDLGALSLTLVMAWAYVSYFQMLIQWAGNIPREVVWYIARTNGGWSVVAWIIAILAFILPFALLLTIRVRHNLRALGGVSIMLLVANLVINFWQVKPAFSPNGFAISLLDIAMPVAMGGIWVGVFLYTLSRRPALTVPDQATLNLTGAGEQAVSH
jgi:hypothetical protein